MIDEQLIDEVAHHGVIYNRQKYYLNGGSGSGGGGSSLSKYETKDEAWQTIAHKLRSDVETCKKRWKYLRERYVSQRKQGDPPVYEHLSRPYLEKMKFLDQHIQPRKSYRNVPNFLTSPHSANSSNYGEFNIDSKSNGSMKSNPFGSNATTSQSYGGQQQQQHEVMNSGIENDSAVKIEADQVFRDFAAAVASQQLQQISQSQITHHQAAAVAAAIADSSQNYHEHFRESDAAENNLNGNNDAANTSASCNGIASSSSSLKSPLSSPLPVGVSVTLNNGHCSSATQQVAAHSSSSVNQPHLNHNGFNVTTNSDDLDASNTNNIHMKKPRVQLNSNIQSNGHSTNHHSTNSIHGSNATNNCHFVDDSDDDSDDNNRPMLHPQTILNDHSNSHFHSLPSASGSSLNQRNSNNVGNNHNNHQQQNMFQPNADFLFQLYQQQQQQHLQQHQHHQQHQHNSQQQSVTSQQNNFNKFPIVPSISNPPQRGSEVLLGELVTTELLKMSKDRRKHVQKRILEILFFED